MGAGPRTHQAIDPRWSGEVVELSEGRSRVRLETIDEMAADRAGLVHGGFLFSLADYAAMLAVNEPTVVAASAEVAFRAPVAVGDVVIAEARRESVEGSRSTVEVEVELSDVGGRRLGRATFQCVVPPRHVLEPRG